MTFISPSGRVVPLHTIVTCKPSKSSLIDSGKSILMAALANVRAHLDTSVLKLTTGQVSQMAALAMDQDA